MDAKLTLKLDKQVIEQAKKYAKEHGQSLSRMIENYLKLLTRKGAMDKTEEPQISDYVKSIPIKLDLPEVFDYKEEYYNYVEEKHK
jgi:hypothetical protein